MADLVTVFILNWNRKDELIKAIESVVNQTYKNIEILLVDSASDDGAPDLARICFPDISIVCLDKNYGCVEGRNMGVEYVTGDYIFFMDNDAILHPQAVENAYETIIRNDNIAVVGGCVKPFVNHDEIDLDPIKFKSEPLFSNNFQGGVCLIRKSAFIVAGKYPGYYVYGGEETHLVLNLMKHHYQIVKDIDVILWHKKSAKQRNQVHEMIMRQSNHLRNRIVLWPIEYTLIYLCKSLIKHPYQAFTAGIFKQWLKKWSKTIPGVVVHSFKQRNPVKRSLIRHYYYQSMHEATDKDYIIKREGYLKTILFEFFKS